MSGVNQPIISDAFISLDQFNTLVGYNVYDVLSNAYINDGTTIWFRGNFYTLMGEDGYLYTRVGFAMATNPFLMGFSTPIFMNGTWSASFTIMSRGRPTRMDVSGMSYLDAWDVLISEYTNNVMPS